MLFLNTILDIIFPTKCLACGETGSDFCAKCFSDIPTAERESARWIFPVYDYRHPPIKKALWFLKYKGRKRLAKIFSEVIYEKIIEELSDLSVMENFNDVILIPIPLHKKRSRERGYNQAELICKEIIAINHLRSTDAKALADRHGVDVNIELENNVLVKIKETEHQARIRDRRVRLKNLVDSFSVQNENLIKKRNIILIDDITTTGATSNEAKKVLKASGARKIIAFTVAH